MLTRKVHALRPKFWDQSAHSSTSFLLSHSYGSHGLQLSLGKPTRCGWDFRHNASPKCSRVCQDLTDHQRLLNAQLCDLLATYVCRLINILSYHMKDCINRNSWKTYLGALSEVILVKSGAATPQHWTVVARPTTGLLHKIKYQTNPTKTKTNVMLLWYTLQK